MIKYKFEFDFEKINSNDIQNVTEHYFNFINLA